MESKSFVNRDFDIQIRKLEDIRKQELELAAERANFDAIIAIADVIYQKALARSENYDELRLFFRNVLEFVSIQRVNKEGDYINEASLDFYDYIDASRFLAACKLFVGVSSSYSLTVNRYKFVFYFNYDRLCIEDIYDED